jgi:hypothetical protein
MKNGNDIQNDIPGAIVLTPKMRQLREFILKNGGDIKRFPGGFWTLEPVGRLPSFGTSSVQALVTRGILKYTDWRKHSGSDRQFPVQASIAD